MHCVTEEGLNLLSLLFLLPTLRIYSRAPLPMLSLCAAVHLTQSPVFSRQAYPPFPKGCVLTSTCIHEEPHSPYAF